MTESITTSYPRRSAWTHARLESIREQYKAIEADGYFSQQATAMRVVMSYLSARLDRIMVQCLADEVEDGLVMTPGGLVKESELEFEDG